MTQNLRMDCETQKVFAQTMSREEWGYLCTKKEFIEAVDSKGLKYCLELKKKLLRPTVRITLK